MGKMSNRSARKRTEHERAQKTQAKQAISTHARLEGLTVASPGDLASEVAKHRQVGRMRGGQR